MMKDFTSAALYALIVKELTRQGIPLQTMAAAMPRQALVPLELKHAVLRAVFDRYGPAPLLRVGEGISRLGFEPALDVMLRAHSPKELILRWQRLERFTTSRHRLVIADEFAGGFVLAHTSLVADDVPLAGENALILGLIVALFGAIGCRGIRAGFVAHRGQAVFDDSQLRELVAWPADSSRWLVSWEACASRPGLDLNAPGLPEPEALFNTAAPLPPIIRHATRLLYADPARLWSLPELAATLGISKRSFQRRLSEAGLTFPGLMRAVQIRVSCRLLLETGHSPSEIGYQCGFSDQAHFCREFKRRTNLSPLQFRLNFRTEKRALQEPAAAAPQFCSVTGSR